MRLEFFIALRYLRSSKKSRSVSFITNIAVVGVTIGVAALIVVLSIMNGFEQDLKKALVGALWKNSKSINKLDKTRNFYNTRAILQNL